MSKHILFAGPPRTRTTTIYHFYKKLDPTIVPSSKQVYDPTSLLSQIEIMEPTILFYPDFINHFLCNSSNNIDQVANHVKTLVFTLRPSLSRIFSHLSLRYLASSKNHAQILYNIYSPLDPYLSDPYSVLNNHQRSFSNMQIKYLHVDSPLLHIHLLSLYSQISRKPVSFNKKHKSILSRKFAASSPRIDERIINSLLSQ